MCSGDGRREGSGSSAEDPQVKVFLREDIYKSPTGGGGFLAGVMTLNYNIYIYT